MNEKKGLVSVIVASYNYERYLNKRITSLINQSYKNVEILIIDDNSSDNSKNILKQWKNHPKIKIIINKVNEGWVKVSNKGLKLSSGEFVMFANCDDYCDEFLIEDLVKKLFDFKSAGLAFCKSFLVDDNDEILGIDYENREREFKNFCSKSCLIPKFLASKFLMHSCIMPNLSSILFRKKCFNEVGFFSENYVACSDWVIFFKIAKSYDFYFENKPLNFFRQHKKTIRNGMSQKETLDEFFKLLFSQLSDNYFLGNERKNFRVHIIYLWITYLINLRGSTFIFFFYHLKEIYKYDKKTLIYFFHGFFRRTNELNVKLFKSIVNVNETELFLKSIFSRPKSFFLDLVQLITFILYKIKNKILLRFINDSNFFKVKPPWYNKNVFSIKTKNSFNLNFPSLSVRVVNFEDKNLIFNPKDVEYEYYKIRWSDSIRYLNNKQCAKKYFHEIFDKINNPPDKKNIFWEVYSTCERVSNLLILLAKHPYFVTKNKKAIVVSFLENSGKWILSNLEYYGENQTNNHFLNNGRALLMIGSVINDDNLITQGFMVLRYFLPKICHKSGYIKEGSTNYQLIISTWIFDCLLFVKNKISKSQYEELNFYANKMAKVCSTILEIDPKLINNVGDISPDLNSNYLLKKIKALHFSRLSKSKFPIKYGELFFVKSNNHKLISRVQNNSPKEFLSHSHNDLTSFIWSFNENPILVDLGKKNYIKHQYFHQSNYADHNTISLSNIGALPSSLSSFAEVFLKRYSKSEAHLKFKKNQLIITHDGFKRIKNVGQHTRKITFKGKNLIVNDYLEGWGKFNISLFWHFHPSLTKIKENNLISKNGKLILNIETISKNIRSYWKENIFSCDYGAQEISRTLIFKSEIELPLKISTKFTILKCAE